MSATSKISSAEDRLDELNTSIRIQEGLLDRGAERLGNLNDQYSDLERKYQSLLTRKKRLVEEVESLAQNADLFSDF